MPSADNSNKSFDELIAAIDFLKEANGLNSKQGIALWNDAPERTKEDVLAAYDKAIALADKRALS